MAKVYVVNPKNKILVIRRSATDPRWAFDWDVPGGSIEYGEDPKETCVREAQEEAGLVLDKEALKLLDVSSLSDGDAAITILYITKNQPKTILLSYEHDMYKWVNIDELLELKMPEKYKIAAKKLPEVWHAQAYNEKL